MLKPRLILVVRFGINALCFAKLPTQPTGRTKTIIMDDNSTESDLQGYVYAFSTADSNMGIQETLLQQASFHLIEREIPHFGTDNRYHWIRMDIKMRE